MVTERIAREREAMARAPRQHMQPAEQPNAEEMGAEDAHYMEPAIDPQWMWAYKLFTDAEGEYGIPYLVPIGQWSAGANALVNMRRRDGGYAWTAVKPERLAPKGTIECVSERCGDAHLGGRRKMLPTLDALIKHVQTFHPDEFETYHKYFDKIQDDLARANPRLQALMGASVGAPLGVVEAPAIFYCEADDECTRFFDSQSGLDLHVRREHRGASDGA